MLRYGLIVGLLLSCLSRVAAQDAANKIEEISLRVTPAAEPRPALEYSLWTPDRELQAGNGAPFYYRAMLLRQQIQRSTEKDFPADKVHDWLSVPLAEFPKADAKKYLDLHRNVFKELTIATMRERCEWDLRVKDLQGTEVVEFLLHDFQEMRDLTRLVAIQARYDVAERKFDKALTALRMGYRIAHDTAEVPLLINGLIGIASASITNSVVVDWINTPDSPNLYWALKQLPHPLVDIRPALQFEMNMPFQMFPFLADAETKPRSPEEWQTLMQNMAGSLHELGAMGGTDIASTAWQTKLFMATQAIKAYPIAKQELIESGLTATEVEKMPVAQVLAIQTARRYRHTYHEMFKWSLLPYPEARVRMAQSQERLKRDGYFGRPMESNDVIPIASLLLPAIDSVVVATARNDGRFAALETIEALRMQASIGPAQLPPTLTAIQVVPVPVNPFTGKHFDYRVENGKGVLQESSLTTDPLRAGDRRYLIELEKAVK